jgi:tetratricopeptide (TPR) repeat protein
VITGTAGVGKTSLAVHWAHQVAGHHPDGQLYLDLRGRAGDAALTVTEALSVLLQSLGVPGERIPVDLHLQMGLYRSVLAQRRMLVVLDNAADAAHVRPLLPGGPDCHVLVTSRDALTGLVVREGAARITLHTFDPAESLQLLTTQLGQERIAAEPKAAAELAELCAHLPLALRIAGANLASRPAQSVSGMIAELGGTDLLAQLQVVGDPETAVAAAFDLSYRSLSPEAGRLFRMLGVMPGPEASREAAAVLLDRGLDAAVPELDELLAAHLLFEPRPGRYRSHDLLALYARRLARTEPAEVREPALHRLMSFYLLSVDAATQLIMPGFWVVFPDDIQLVGSPHAFDEPRDAEDWLRVELANLTVAVGHVAEHGPAPFAWHLAHALRGYFTSYRTNVDALAVGRTGLRAAEAVDHPLGRGLCHMSLGFAAGAIGDSDAAIDEFDAAKVQFTRVGYARGLAAAWNDTAEACITQGRLREAHTHISKALEFHVSYTPSRAIHHATTAEIFRIQGHHDLAQQHVKQAAALAAQSGAAQILAIAALEGGLTALAMGRFAEAEESLTECRNLAEFVGSELNHYDALAALACLCVRTGRASEALEWIEPLRELIARGVVGFAPEDLAEVSIVEAYLATDRLDLALTVGRAALFRRVEIGHGLTATRLRLSLGRVHAADGDLASARSLWKDALPLAIEESLPERAMLEGLLSAGSAAVREA